jgi:hypothetical protein
LSRAQERLSHQQHCVEDDVQLAPLLARISTDDQFQFGIRTFLAGLNAQQPELTRPRP